MMLLRQQTQHMIANSNAGKNMNVTTTAANSVVANSTNINSRIISTLDGHPGFFLCRDIPRRDQIITSSQLCLFKHDVVQDTAFT